MMAIIAALMNMTGKTHVRVTSADVTAAIASCMLHVRSPDPSCMDIYLVTQPSEAHVGLDYAEPYVPADDVKRLQ